jgi:hypothetical protein
MVFSLGGKVNSVVIFALIFAILAITLLFRRTRLLAIVPRVRHDDDKLVARTSLGGFLLSLTLLYRTVVVDRGQQSISSSIRFFWVFRRSRTIPFAEVEKIIYRYEDMNPSSSLGFSGDSKDWYSVKLRLTGDREIHLFHFYGEGEFQHGSLDWVPGWAYWNERLFDMQGTQDEDSRTFVKQLERILRVGTVN